MKNKVLKTLLVIAGSVTTYGIAGIDMGWIYLVMTCCGGAFLFIELIANWDRIVREK